MKLPKTLFVHVENEGDRRNEYLAASITAEDAIEDDGPTVIGEYRLVKVSKLKKVSVDA